MKHTEENRTNRAHNYMAPISYRTTKALCLIKSYHHPRPTRAAPDPRLRRSVVSRPFAFVRELVQGVVLQTRRGQVSSSVRADRFAPGPNGAAGFALQFGLADSIKVRIVYGKFPIASSHRAF